MPQSLLFNRALCSVTLLLCLSGQALSAQNLLERGSEDRSMPEGSQQMEIPVFFEDEMDDIGPQYLLTPGTPPHDWFHAVLDGQILYVSNPTLADDDSANGTDLIVLTAQFEARSRGENLLGGEAFVSAGLRYQVFQYGSLSDPDELVDGLPVSANDFEAASVYGYIKWTRDKWDVRVGLNWSELYNDSSSGGFYKELFPSISVSRIVTLDEATILRLGYSGSWYFSQSESFALPRDDFNDRITNTLSASIMHQLFEGFTVSPGLSANSSVYTNDLNGGRDDITLAATLFFTFDPFEHASFRFQIGAQKRYSSQDAIVEYESYDSGLGGTFNYSF